MRVPDDLAHFLVDSSNKKYFFNDGIEYGSVEDERDGHVYKTVEINGMTWMAENLSYFVEKAECKDSLTIGCIYAWDAALNMSEGERLQEVNQGICMAGWHVPDTTEWYKLLGNRPLDDFKSEVGWKKGSNATGFSAVPISYSPIISISMGGSYRDMNSATFITLNKGFKMPPIDDALVIGNVAVFDVDAFRVNPATADRTLSFSFESYPKGALRCVKDYE